MSAAALSPAELRLAIDPATLDFGDTRALVDEPLPWIGQERAEAAAHFGLAMEAPDYNLFVLGETGSGRSSLLRQAMRDVAARRRVPPDLCYLHNFDTPERPLALRLPAGEGRLLRQSLAHAVKIFQEEIPRRLEGPDYKAEAARIEQAWKDEVAGLYAQLSAFAEARSFSLHRENGRMVFTLTGKKGQALTEDEVLALPKARRAQVEHGEQELRAEITHYIEETQPLERAMNEALATLRRQMAKPLVERGLEAIREALKKQIKDAAKLNAWLDALQTDVLDGLELFYGDADDTERLDALHTVLGRYRVNVVVDNSGLAGAPVIVEENPLFRALFGSIEYQTESDVLVTDFSRIRAGSLLRAHGGFLMLHLADVLADSLVWEKLRRFLRSGRLQIEEPGVSFSPIATVSLVPEAIDVDVKLVLIGSREQYYELQEVAPEVARHFRAKVDFADRFPASAETRRASAIFVAHTCRQHGLPHFSAAAVARLLEESHREADDRTRQSALFARAEALVIESATQARARGATRADAMDVEAALTARVARHDHPEQRLREAIVEGDVLIDVNGEATGRLNGVSVADLGDYRFGAPVRLSARAFAGDAGIVNIEREVELSGPIHDKGVLILEHYLNGLFAANAPLSLSASIVFEQQYHGVEGDSASCAELYALLSALSGLPLAQGIAVTGAVNQHGEVLPVGGINEKIEGWFRVCEAIGLDGRQGVLIPARNCRHLMLAPQVVAAVTAGHFHVHVAATVAEGIEHLAGVAAGEADAAGRYPAQSVFGRVQTRLQAFRRACRAAPERRARASTRRKPDQPA